MIESGCTDPRNATRPSLRQLAERMGVSTSTASAMVYGTRVTDVANVDAAAEALRLDPLTVTEWVDRVRTVKAPYQPPSVANLLGQDERDAVDQLIRLLARSKTREGETDAHSAEARKKSSAGAPLPLQEARQRRMMEQSTMKKRAAYRPGEEDHE